MINLYPIKIKVLCAPDPIAIGSPNTKGRHSKIPASGGAHNTSIAIQENIFNRNKANFIHDNN